MFDAGAGTLTLVEGILPGVAYEARARPIIDGAAAWTSWLSGTPSTVLLGAADVLITSISQRIGLADADQLVDSFDPANGVGFMATGILVAPFAYDYAPPAIASSPVAFSVSGAARTVGDYASKVVIQLERKLVFPFWPGTVIRTWEVGAGRSPQHFLIEAVGNDLFDSGPGYEYRLTAYIPQGCLPVRLSAPTLHLRQAGS